MNCPSCLGRLWLRDWQGEFFKCLDCNGTGEIRKEVKHELAPVVDLAAARRLRDRRRLKAVGPKPTGNDAA